MSKKNLAVYSLAFILISIGSYFGFNYLIPISNSITIKTDSVPLTTQKQTGSLTFQGPKTEICPLNGELFTKEERTLWETRRPLAVMIENHSESRPQSGLNNADIVYEANSEGGITRFMGVFYCNAVKGSTNKYDVGPVRSARTYFLDLASEYSDYPLYAHVGGSNCSAPLDPVTGRAAGPCTTNKKAQALEQISDYGWQNKGTWGDLSQFSLSYKACRREEDRTGDIKATEHTMYCSTNELWNVAASRGLTNETIINKTLWNKNFKSWSFKQVDQPSSTVDAKTISFDWWGDKAYSVSWTYDSIQKLYLRQNGGSVAIDFNTKEQINSKNIIIQWTKESRSIDSHVHNLYAVVGTGEGVLLQNGTKTDITWSKPNRTAKTIFKDKSGKEVNLVPGRTWIEILPLGNKVSYES
ncbi:MAG: DUF3048 domain-containing protein [Candidatus Shapirobacteria bacterium]